MVHHGDLSQLLTKNILQHSTLIRLTKEQVVQNSTLIRLTKEEVGLIREQTRQNKAAQDKWNCGQEDWNRRQQGWNSKTETCIKNVQDQLVGVEGQLQHLVRTVEKQRAETDSKLDTMKKELDLHRWVLVNLSAFVFTAVIVGILWIAKDDSGQT